MGDYKRRTWWETILIVVVLALGVAVICRSTGPYVKLFEVWILGALGLGLMSGFVTGASEKEGSGHELLGFVAALIVPVLGALASLLQQVQTTSETTTYNPAGAIATKITTVVSKSESFLLHPLVIASSFFVVYGLSVILGIGLGVLRRKGEGGIKLRP